MTLLLRLLISRITSDKGGDWCDATATALLGIVPVRTFPVMVPPTSRQISCNTRAPNSCCDNAKRNTSNSPQEPAPRPVTRIRTLSPDTVVSVVTVGEPGHCPSTQATFASSSTPGSGGSTKYFQVLVAGSGENTRRIAPKPTIKASGLAL